MPYSIAQYEEGNPEELRREGVWLPRASREPEGSMILWRRPKDGGGWFLSLAYRAKGGRYVDCGGAAGGDISAMTEFMEIPD